MKNRKLLALIGMILLSTPIFAQQSQFEFIYNHTAEIASFAHPMNTRIKGMSIIEDNGGYIDITIRYKQATTKIRFVKQGTFFSDMYVLSDTDSWPAFFAVGAMKDVAIDIIQEEIAKNPKKASALEQYFLENVKSWSGRQLAMFCLYLMFLK